MFDKAESCEKFGFDFTLSMQCYKNFDDKEESKKILEITYTWFQKCITLKKCIK